MTTVLFKCHFLVHGRDCLPTTNSTINKQNTFMNNGAIFCS